jgi:Flp pilus assembly protein TadD
MKKYIAIALLVATPLAQASAANPVDNYGADVIIKAGKYQQAAVRLEARVAQVPKDETALLNLALAYRHIGREADAQTAFRRVLALEDVILDTTDGRAVSSHALARYGLKQPTTLSLR